MSIRPFRYPVVQVTMLSVHTLSIFTLAITLLTGHLMPSIMIVYLLVSVGIVIVPPEIAKFNSLPP